ncbi:MAG: MFS transporter [Chloroflexi bacterium]|nr:MFS transporter [Chloroflexota bacterium]
MSDQVQAPPQLSFSPAAPPRRRLYYGWYIVMAASTVTFIEMAGFNTTFSVFIKPMTEEFGWTRAQFALGVTFGSLAAGIVVALVGRLIDRHGPKYVILGGAGLLTLCLALLSQTSALWQLWLLFGLSRAVSSATLDLSTTVLVSNWFVDLRGRAMGLASLGRRFGIGLLPLMAQGLIVPFGWRVGWIGVAGTVALIGFLPTALIVKRRPEDIGLRPDGAATDKAASPASAASVRGRRVHRQDVSWTLKEATRTPAFWLLMGAGCASFFVGGSVNLHQVAHMVDRGLSPTVAVTSLTVYALAGAVGTLFWGWLTDYIPVRYCFAMNVVWAALGVLLLNFTSSEFMAYFYAIFYGLAFGGMIPLTATAWADYFGRKALGSIRGAALIAQMVVNAIGPLFAGVVYDTYGSYQWAWVTFAGSYLAAMALILMARVPRRPSETAAA